MQHVRVVVGNDYCNEIAFFSSSFNTESFIAAIRLIIIPQLVVRKYSGQFSASFSLSSLFSILDAYLWRMLYWVCIYTRVKSHGSISHMDGRKSATSWISTIILNLWWTRCKFSLQVFNFWARLYQQYLYEDLHM